jgi:hypothetical protein
MRNAARNSDMAYTCDRGDKGDAFEHRMVSTYSMQLGCNSQVRMPSFMVKMTTASTISCVLNTGHLGIRPEKITRNALRTPYTLA